MTKVLSPVLSYFGNNKAVNTGVDQQVRGDQNAQTALQPYMNTGTQANTMLQNDLSNGQLGGTFTPGDLTKDPGYQFNLTQGQQALDRKQSASGNFFSGEALKAAQQFGQGLADQTYNDAYNRDLSRQSNLNNILSGQQSQGRGAATNYGGYAANIGQTQSQGTLQKQNNKNQMFQGLSSALGGGYF